MGGQLAAVLGTGQTKYVAKRQDVSMLGLVREAIDRALEDSGSTFDDIDASSFDVIVTLSPEAHHRALEYTRAAAVEVEYWPVTDPSAVEGTREMRLDAYRRTRDQILGRLKARFGAPSGPSV